MAKIGLKALQFATLTEGETNTYGTPASLGKAVSTTVTPKVAEATLYADDTAVESAKVVSSATVEVEIDDKRETTVLAVLLGHTVGTGADAGQVTRKVTDNPIYVGLGRIVPIIRGGTKLFIAEFLPKVQFAEPSQEDKTKGENVEFSTVKLSGTAYATSDDRWSDSFETTTQALAQAWLDDKFGVVEG